MAKKVMAMIKLQVEAGKANPSPPIGPALGQHGVNIMDFCKAFNARTANDAGMIIPVVITVYQDRSFTFITKTPPAAVLLKKAAKVAKGAAQGMVVIPRDAVMPGDGIDHVFVVEGDRARKRLDPGRPFFTKDKFGYRRISSGMPVETAAVRH